MLPNQTWVCSPISKANLLTPGHGQGKHSVSCSHEARSPVCSCSEYMNSPMAFRVRNESFRMCDHLFDFLLIGWW